VPHPRPRRPTPHPEAYHVDGAEESLLMRQDAAGESVGLERWARRHVDSLPRTPLPRLPPSVP